MNISRAFDILDHTLGRGKCEECEVKEGCKLLQEVYNIDFCDTFELVSNPRKYIDKK